VERSEIALEIGGVNCVTGILDKITEPLFALSQRFLGLLALTDILQGSANPSHAPARVIKHPIIELDCYESAILSSKGALHPAQFLSASHLFHEGFARSLSVFDKL